MKIKAVSGIKLTLLLVGLLTLAFNIQLVESEPGTMIVPDDYEKIQWAIGNASEGDTIFVRAGTYYENVVVNKTVSLIGENKQHTTIDGGGKRNVVYVHANNVVITGFTIQNGGSHPSYIMVGAICLAGSFSCNITYNIVTNNQAYGIELYSSEDCTLCGNNITNNGRNGISLYESSNNNIYENKIANNSYYGSYYGILLDHSSNNNVSENRIANNPIGVRLRCSSNNRINGNNITANSLGIEFYRSPSNVLRDNVMAGNKYNFEILGEQLLHYMNDVDASNTVDGKPILYLVNEQNLVIEAQTYPNVGYLAAINSTNIIIRDQKMENNYDGILLVYTKDSSIQNVTTINNYYGIRLKWSSNSIISTTNITNNYYGISLDYSNYSNIHGSNITNNKVCGIKLSHSSNNDIYENFMTNNHYGIELLGSSSNTISMNNIANSDGHGIWLVVSSYNTVSGNNMTNNYDGVVLSGASNNSIYHNNFINNTHQVYERTDDPSYNLPSINNWDNGYPSGGNYWSDYNGTDSDGDGVGDIPYVIDENNIDNNPLMNPWNPSWSARIPLWSKWWFWAIVATVIVASAGVVYFLKKRKTPTAPLPSIQD